MRVLVAGATGALGVPLTRALVAAGHEVTGLTRSPEKQGMVAGLGAAPVVADVLDAPGLRRAVAGARPEVVVHALTALPKEGAIRRSQFDATNRLRVQGTANLLDAAIRANTRRLVAESMIFVHGYGDLGPQPLTEDHPFQPVPAVVEPVADALRALERQVFEADAAGRIEGIVLRYGLFYGPDFARGMADMLRRRRFPLPAGGHGVHSWIHVDDAADATLAAVERGRPGAAYHVVDDEPVEFGAFVRHLARLTGVPSPPALPTWLSRLLVPFATAAMGSRIPVSNERTVDELGWRPRHPTYREGLREAVLAPSPG